MAPKPKPTQLKLVSGNPGKRPLNTAEPQAPLSSIRAPSGLSPLARKCWHATAPLLRDARILTTLDRPALVMYCEAAARWRKASDEVQRRGMLVKTPSGYPIQNPYLAIANKAFEQMQKMLVEFGMTPSSRTRVQTTQDIEDDPMAEFLIRKKDDR